jgi:hypothetical protein
VAHRPYPRRLLEVVGREGGEVVSDAIDDDLANRMKATMHLMEQAHDWERLARDESKEDEVREQFDREMEFEHNSGEREDRVEREQMWTWLTPVDESEAA